MCNKQYMSCLFFLFFKYFWLRCRTLSTNDLAIILRSNKLKICILAHTVCEKTLKWGARPLTSCGISLKYMNVARTNVYDTDVNTIQM